MFASIINFILFLLFVYLILYGIYLLTMNIKALISNSAFVSDLSETVSTSDIKLNNICIIIYANSKTKHLSELLRALNEQQYNRDKYCVHVIYAKDSNSLIYTPECMFGAQIHCVENPEFFKKDKAINTFLSKLIPESKFDAYLFLDSNRLVEADYLMNVNNALNAFGSCVVTGRVNVSPSYKDASFKSRIIEARQEFKNNTVNVSRRMFDLASVIDSGNLVITSDIMENIGRVYFETKEHELKYSLFLASNGIKPIYSPFMLTRISSSDFNPTAAGISARISLFRYYLKFLFRKPWYFIEFVISLMQPNVAVLCILYLILLYCSFKFISSIGIKYLVHLGIFYLITFMTGIIASKLNLIKLLYFVFYPFYSFAVNFKKITKDISEKALQKTFNEEKNIKSTSLNAIVTDGTKDVLCKMDLISEDGMRRVILRFRKKRIISDESIRMHDAVLNISKRVKVHGYTLKICRNCTHFNILQDGTVDLLKGTCNINCTEAEPDKTFETLIWNNCNCFKAGADYNLINEIQNPDA